MLTDKFFEDWRVEIVAMEIYRAFVRRILVSSQDRKSYDPDSDALERRWLGCKPAVRQQFREEARAAISAMHHPAVRSIELVKNRLNTEKVIG